MQTMTQGQDKAPQVSAPSSDLIDSGAPIGSAPMGQPAMGMGMPASGMPTQGMGMGQIQTAMHKAGGND